MRISPTWAIITIITTITPTTITIIMTTVARQDPLVATVTLTGMVTVTTAVQRPHAG